MLTVKRAKAKQAADGGAAGKKAVPPVAPLPLDASSRVVYVGNLPWEVDEEVLAATFEVRCRVDCERCKACADARFFALAGAAHRERDVGP